MPQQQSQPRQHEQAITRIASVIRESPDTSGGVQLRRLLWSLYNMHHLVNLWDFASRVGGDLAEPVAEVMHAALTGRLQESDVKRGLLVAGEMQRWDQNPAPGSVMEDLDNAHQSLVRAIRKVPPSDTHTELVRIHRQIEERLSQMRSSPPS